MTGEMTVEIEFLEILRKTCRTMRQARSRPEMAIPAAEWEMKINARLEELERNHQEELRLNGKRSDKAELGLRREEKAAA